mmetsp:Transcript_147254/g.472988  ORF Transcript_147254/g.472988 Transcript_147254/m.472988 type:complete len:91 (-) Transcript_147254:29-301(-)
MAGDTPNRPATSPAATARREASAETPLEANASDAGAKSHEVAAATRSTHVPTPTTLLLRFCPTAASATMFVLSRVRAAGGWRGRALQGDK